MSIRITDVLRHSAKFNAVSVISLLISFPKGIIIALFFSTKDYGTISFVALLFTYTSLVSPGFITLVGRQMPSLLGEKNDAEALRIQNIGYSGELIFSFFEVLVIIAGSFFCKENTIKFGVLFLAIQFLISKISQMYSNTLRAYHEFSKVALAELVGSVANFILTVALIFWLKVYGIFIANAVAAACVLVYFMRVSAISFKFELNFSEMKRMFEISFFLVLQIIAYWGYRVIDKTVISSMLSLEALGMYSFTMTFILIPLMFFTQFGTTLQPMLWRQAGAADSNYQAFAIGKNIIVYLVLATSMIAPLLQIGYYFMVTYITTKYTASLNVFNVLSLYLIVSMPLLIPSLILNSKRINKQKLSLVTYIGGLAANTVLSVLAVKAGFGILGVAVATVISQGFLSFWNYLLIKDYLFKSTREMMYNVLLLTLPLFLVAFFFYAHSYIATLHDMKIVWFGFSVLAQIVCWYLIIIIFYKNFIPENSIARIRREASKLLSGSCSFGKKNQA